MLSKTRVMGEGFFFKFRLQDGSTKEMYVIMDRIEGTNTVRLSLHADKDVAIVGMDRNDVNDLLIDLKNNRNNK